MPFGQTTRTTSALGLLAQAEMKLRPGDRLLLHQQAGADFDFAADAERIDALIANRLRRVRPHDLPVIVLRTLIDCPAPACPSADSPSRSRRPSLLSIGGVEDQRRAHGMRQQRESVRCVAEPDQRAGSVACPESA